VFHLQDYAQYLARRDTLPDLRKSLAVMEAVAQVRDDVAQAEPVSLIVKHTSARQSHELACSVAWRLRELTPPRERTAAAQHTATAWRHLRAVLADPSTRAVLAGPANTRPARWALDAIGPALLDLLRQRPETLSDDERVVVALLVKAADPAASIVGQLTELLAGLLLPDLENRDSLCS
jgi:hypothetical protein